MVIQGQISATTRASKLARIDILALPACTRGLEPDLRLTDSDGPRKTAYIRSRGLSAEWGFVLVTPEPYHLTPPGRFSLGT